MMKIIIGVLNIIQDSLIFLEVINMKKTLWYAVLGNANIAADGMSAVRATAWLHGPIHYHEKYTVEIPDEIVNDPEKYIKTHSGSGDEFIKNVLYPHNPSALTLPEKFQGWKDVKLDYSPKYNMLRILYTFNRGLFIEL